MSLPWPSAVTAPVSENLRNCQVSRESTGEMVVEGGIVGAAADSAASTRAEMMVEMTESIASRKYNTSSSDRVW